MPATSCAVLLDKSRNGRHGSNQFLSLPLFTMDILKDAGEIAQPLRGRGNLDLPIELISDVIDLAALDNRDTDLFWTLNLALVSPTVRHIAMTRAYEIIMLSVARSSKKGNRAQRDIAFLLWLLRDPDAGPRRYIKHLVIAGDHVRSNEFSELDENPASPWNLGCLSVEWQLGRLEDLFFQAGLRPSSSRIFNSVDVEHRRISGMPLTPYTWASTHSAGLDFCTLHLWPWKRRRNEVKLHHTASALGKLSIARGQESSKTIFISIGDANSGFDDLSLEVIEDVFILLLDDSLQQHELVLLCENKYSYKNHTLDEILQHAAAQRADVDGQALLRRVRVARQTSHHAAVLKANPYMAFLRLEADVMRQLVS
ncbi:hypothetical protein BKA62DRAFT_411651 [Auriculariales sp. MPI-PUGE-AT-0066]|nr:hypothetical protein BKA62DRAFT_411651 [Auriculariales sp. MPI-PUGE-AT-0066]